MKAIDYLFHVILRSVDVVAFFLHDHVPIFETKLVVRKRRGIRTRVRRATR